MAVCARYPERFRVVALAAKSSRDKLVGLGRRFKAETLCLADDGDFNEDGFECLTGTRGLLKLAGEREADHVVFSSSGTGAAYALLNAMDTGREISISNKEIIVAAGAWIMERANGPFHLRPIDSEHSAVWQCLRGEPEQEVRKIWLTASGGPFKDFSAAELKHITPEMALKHPVWRMGAKITVDSATMMNKGLECIEAMRLFGLKREQVGALIHPASQAHGMVQFNDGTMKMLIAPADMRIPAAAALAYPGRLNAADSESGFLPPESWRLNFEPIDEDKFPCFKLAMRAAEYGGAYPPLLVGADEAAVKAFLQGKIGFTQIGEVIESVLEGWDSPGPKDIDEAIALVAEGEKLAGEVCDKWRYGR